jgi:hypothetical protein
MTPLFFAILQPVARPAERSRPMMLPTTSLSRTLHEGVDSPSPRLAVHEIAPVMVPSRRLRRLRALLARPRSVRRPPIDMSGRPQD